MVRRHELRPLWLFLSDRIVLDEWTSVVDRTVAKVMSHCVEKYARKNKKKVILLSCHYDVIDWLNPDWIIDCNEQKFIDRRLLSAENRRRQEALSFTVREVSSSTWRGFSKYHYLSDRLAGGKAVYYGLFDGENQIGFIAFTNYVPWRDKSSPMMMHANRIVVHPDYVGIGLGIKLLNSTTDHLLAGGNFSVLIKFSSTSMLKSLIKSPQWECINCGVKIGLTARAKNSFGRNLNPRSFRHNVKTYTFKYLRK